MSSVLPDPPVKQNPERQARVFSYMQRVMSGGEPPADADTAATLAGMVIGIRSGMLQKLHGVTRDQAMAACRRWVDDQAALWGSMAATDSGEGERS